MPADPFRPSPAVTSAVQLVQLSQVFFIAIVQSLLLCHRLPWQLWLAAGVTLGGSAMVVAPNISSVGRVVEGCASAPGSLKVQA